VPSRATIPPQARKRGCLFWGCLGTAVAALVVAVLLGVFLLRTRNRLLDVTETTPRPVPVARVSSQAAAAARRQAESLATALQQNLAGEFSFTAADLNALVATVPEAHEARGKVLFSIDGDQLNALASLPLDEVPGLAGRYLNEAQIRLELGCENGVLRLQAREVAVKGKPLPKTLMSRLRRVNLAAPLNRRADAAALLQRIERVEVRDGRVVVGTRTMP
jgi:hypothetical protein